MNLVCLLPYCPLPVDSGARSIFQKHLAFLKGFGDCTILSVKVRPVGFGWFPEHIETLNRQGVKVSFNDLKMNNIIPRAYGVAYAALFKFFKADGAFGHSNPYHRFAFDNDWVYQNTKGMDICEIHYSYWARLKTACPKVVVIHDIWSDIMWEGTALETIELSLADLLVTVSYDDMVKLKNRGLQNVHWSPPCVSETIFPDSCEVGFVGSSNRHNVEGLEWLKKYKEIGGITGIRGYGSICHFVGKDSRFEAKGFYSDSSTPYKECGIILMLAKGGTGIQIKGIEALANGRAIVARKGAMRGLPRDIEGWIEVETVEEMYSAIKELKTNHATRMGLMKKAREYYRRYLDRSVILEDLRFRYASL